MGAGGSVPLNLTKNAMSFAFVSNSQMATWPTDGTVNRFVNDDPDLTATSCMSMGCISRPTAVLQAGNRSQVQSASHRAATAGAYRHGSSVFSLSSSLRNSRSVLDFASWGMATTSASHSCRASCFFDKYVLSSERKDPDWGSTGTPTRGNMCTSCTREHTHRHTDTHRHTQKHTRDQRNHGR